MTAWMQPWIQRAKTAWRAVRAWLRPGLRFFDQLMADMNRRNTAVLAAGAAYFAVLAFFPLMLAAVAIASIVIDPAQLGEVASDLNAYLPRDIASLVRTQLEVASRQRAGSVVVAAVGLGLSIFWASGFIENLARALNGVHGVVERRSWLQMKAMSISLTVAAIGLVYIVALVVPYGRTQLLAQGWPLGLAVVGAALRWLVVLAVMALAVTSLYRFGRYQPRRGRHPQPWFSWGSAVAVALWALLTGVFFVYAWRFANFSDSYSLFAGVIVLMLWCNLSATALLIGAHVDVITERRRKP